jgi:hypothetical protein
MIDNLGPSRRKQFGLKSNEQLLDPQTNLRAAKQVKDSSGFGAWTTFKSGKYKQFLPELQKTAAGLPNNPPTTQLSQQTTQQPASPNIYNFYVSEDNQDTEDYLPSPIKFLNNYSKNLFDVPSALQAAFNSGGNINLS